MDDKSLSKWFLKTRLPRMCRSCSPANTSKEPMQSIPWKGFVLRCYSTERIRFCPRAPFGHGLLVLQDEPFQLLRRLWDLGEILELLFRIPQQQIGDCRGAGPMTHSPKPGGLITIFDSKLPPWTGPSGYPHIEKGASIPIWHGLVSVAEPPLLV